MPTPDTFEEENMDNPFEQFVLDSVSFDEKGHAKLVSLHGLSRLLMKFYREVAIPEIAEAKAQERERWINQPANKHDDKIRKDERDRIKNMFIEIRGKHKGHLKGYFYSECDACKNEGNTNITTCITALSTPLKEGNV